MPKLMYTRKPIGLRKSKGMMGGRIGLYMEPEEPEISPEKKEQLNEIVDKLSKIKIINPAKGARAKKETKNKYINI
jgi:hypothetical protein